MRPTVESVTADVYDELASFVEDDESYGWASLYLVDAVAHLLQPVEDLVRDTDAGPGWSGALDPARAPEGGLDWLAQVAGLRVPAAWSTTAKRGQIAHPGPLVGQPLAMVNAAKQYLTGNRTVLMFERDGGPFLLTVATRTSETPDAAAVEQALRAQKPAGLLLTYVVVSGQIINEIAATVNGIGATTIDQLRTTNV
jgi:hypothetical protein